MFALASFLLELAANVLRMTDLIHFPGHVAAILLGLTGTKLFYSLGYAFEKDFYTASSWCKVWALSAVADMLFRNLLRDGLRIVRAVFLMASWDVVFVLVYTVSPAAVLLYGIRGYRSVVKKHGAEKEEYQVWRKHNPQVGRRMFFRMVCLFLIISIVSFGVRFLPARQATGEAVAFYMETPAPRTENEYVGGYRGDETRRSISTVDDVKHYFDSMEEEEEYEYQDAFAYLRVAPENITPVDSKQVSDLHPVIRQLYGGGFLRKEAIQIKEYEVKLNDGTFVTATYPDKPVEELVRSDAMLIALPLGMVYAEYQGEINTSSAELDKKRIRTDGYFAFYTKYIDIADKYLRIERAALALLAVFAFALARKADDCVELSAAEPDGQTSTE